MLCILLAGFYLAAKAYPVQGVVVIPQRCYSAGYSWRRDGNVRLLKTMSTRQPHYAFVQTKTNVIFHHFHDRKPGKKMMGIYFVRYGNLTGMFALLIMQICGLISRCIERNLHPDQNVQPPRRCGALIEPSIGGKPRVTPVRTHLFKQDPLCTLPLLRYVVAA